jgi:hypothetical protein
LFLLVNLKASAQLLPLRTKQLSRVCRQMVDFGSDQGISDIETKGVAALRREF